MTGIMLKPIKAKLFETSSNPVAIPPRIVRAEHHGDHQGRLKIALITVSGGLVNTTVYSLVIFLRGRQCLIEIPQEVIKALQADGNTDHIRADAGRDLLLIG